MRRLEVGMSPEARRCTRWTGLGRYGVDRTLAAGPRPCLDGAPIGVKRGAVGVARSGAGFAVGGVKSPTDLVLYGVAGWRAGLAGRDVAGVGA